MQKHSSCCILSGSNFLFNYSIYWGYVGEEKYWVNTFWAHNYSNALFLNSPPWSLCMDLMKYPTSLWTFLQKTSKFAKNSFLWVKNIIHVNLEKSSTITKAYVLTPKVAVQVGPKSSIWRNCRGLDVLTMYLPLKDERVLLTHLTCITDVIFFKL